MDVRQILICNGNLRCILTPLILYYDANSTTIILILQMNKLRQKKGK